MWSDHGYELLTAYMTDRLTIRLKICTRFVTFYTISDSTCLSDCDLSIWVAVTESCYPSSKQSDRSCLDWYNFVCPHPKCSLEVCCLFYRLALYELYPFVSVCVSLTLYPSLCVLLGILWHYIANTTALCVMTRVPQYVLMYLSLYNPFSLIFVCLVL
jgi:hypothetical protein